MTGGRLAIFSIVFGVFYFVSFYCDLALFRCQPVPLPAQRPPGRGNTVVRLDRHVGPRERGIAFAVPRTLAERLSPRWPWIIPTAVTVGMLIYERRWFVS